MQLPEIPENEANRQAALKAYQILDTLSEAEYDEITALASFICETPISLISLIDDHRQWFKSNLGIDVTETPKEIAFCAHAINDPKNPLVVEDARKDERFFDNPLVTEQPNVVFYAGIPLVNEDGFALGTLCVIDQKPKELKPAQLKALQLLANQLMKLLELRKKSHHLTTINFELQTKNEALEKFARVAAHDIKSPLNNIIMLADLLEMSLGENLLEKDKSLIKEIQDASQELSIFIQGILDYSKSSNLLQESKENIYVLDLVLDVVKQSFATTEMKLIIDIDSHIMLYSNAIALKQIFINLITNALKYNDSPHPEIEIKAKETKASLCISVLDNGIGIAAEDFDRIFNLFETASERDRNGEKGTGIGLPTVKSLVTALDGTIAVKSTIGIGSEFIICFNN